MGSAKHAGCVAAKDDSTLTSMAKEGSEADEAKCVRFRMWR